MRFHLGGQGFTLLEAVFALAIVSLAVTVSLAAVGAELQAASKGRMALEATALAEERLAALVLVDAAKLEALPESLVKGRFSKPFDGYRWSASARRVPNEIGVYELTVVVESASIDRRLVTRIFRPPIELLAP
jgi:type II secretory pathway pseudopilin PulG